MKETLSELIKGYEGNYDFTLPKRTPIILRVDGKAFHTLTRGFDKPFDKVMIQSMQDTMLYLCEQIQGAQFGYVQSDEISILVYETNNEAEPWFGNRLQKLCSITASMATLKFNKSLAYNAAITEGVDYDKYRTAITNGALFDTRAFCVPESVVTPYFIWRQNDAVRNSILGLSMIYFTKKEMYKLSCDELQNKLITEKDVNWNNCSTVQKRGTCCYKILETPETKHKKWFLDEEMPTLSSNRDFVLSKIEEYKP